MRPFRHIFIMRHHHNRDPLSIIEVFEYFHDFVTHHGVQIARRFVGEYDIRLTDNGSGDGNTLTLTT